MVQADTRMNLLARRATEQGKPFRLITDITEAPLAANMSSAAPAMALVKQGSNERIYSNKHSVFLLGRLKKLSYLV
jgi:hypothetical protein